MNIAALGSLVIALAAATVAQPASAAPAARRVVAAPSSVKALPPACPAAGRRSADVLALRVIGLTERWVGPGQRLVCFSETAPQDAVDIGVISGLIDDGYLEGIDYRVQDGLLYGLGNARGIYVLNTTTGAATLVNRVSDDLVTDGFPASIDFDPVGNRLRIFNDLGQNLRVDVNPGGATVDDTGATGLVALGGLAYTNNDLSNKTNSLLYNFYGNGLVLQSLDSGASQGIGNNIDLPEGPWDITAPHALDIYSAVRNGVTVTNEALAMFMLEAGLEEFWLYRIDLSTGKGTPVRKFSERMRDLAIPLNQR